MINVSKVVYQDDGDQRDNRDYLEDRVNQDHEDNQDHKHYCYIIKK